MPGSIVRRHATLTGTDSRPGRNSSRQEAPADLPRTLEWVVLDDEDATQTADHPSSRWRYDLDPDQDGTTLVRHCFVHGPGDSGLRWMMRRHPERSAEIIEDRRRTLPANMRHALAAMKATAEEQPCWQWTAQRPGQPSVDRGRRGRWLSSGQAYFCTIAPRFGSAASMCLPAPLRTAPYAFTTVARPDSRAISSVTASSAVDTSSPRLTR
jgi:hypothetical protein